MIEPLKDLPENVLGFRAVGTVEPEDYTQVLDPAIEAALAKHGKVNFVYVLGPEYDHYSLGAMWQDAKLGIRPLRDWGRLALVTDHSAYKHAVTLFHFLIPAELRVFSLEQLDEAVAWAGAA